MLHVVRHAIREMLLQERVFGAQAFIYTGSRSEPDVFVDAILNDTYTPGLGSGSMYGKGLYAVHDLEGTATAKGDYGEYVYKLRVNLYGYISFDDDVTSLIYGRAMPPSEQARLVKAPRDVIEILKRVDEPKPGEVYSSWRAHEVANQLKGLVKGLIFTGSRDGRVVVVYDVSTATPVAWKRALDDGWNSVDRALVKKSLVKNVSGDFKSEKYEKAEIDDQLALKKLKRLLPSMRSYDGNLKLSGESITSLPDNLTVNGYLYLDNNPITRLPENLTVNGDLYINNTGIIKIPASLVVRGILGIGPGVQEIEPGVTARSLLISNNETLSVIPDGVNIDHSIEIEKSVITELPAGMRLRRFTIRNCNIQRLPEDLEVDTLNLRNTQITELPDTLRVHNSLLANNMPLKRLPDNLTLQGRLEVMNTDLTELPAGLNVMGPVYVQGTKITSVPPDARIREIYGLPEQTVDRDAEFASTF